MHRLQLHYELSNDHGKAPTAREAVVRNPLIDLLQALVRAGSISAAARLMGLSYRHVWGELKRWQLVLGHDLVVWEKGQSARLTEFAAKLLWAEAQAQARLAPQIEALRSELERTFAIAFDDSAHVLTLYASHDDALGALREHALHAGDVALHLDIQFMGSVDAIRALNEGRCMMAGFHTAMQPSRGSMAERTYKPLLQPGLHKVIGFATRTQGLMVAKGNPLGIRGIGDLAGGNAEWAPKRQARYANRALGTGTRVLFDELLCEAGFTSEHILGFDRTEPSHVAVAQAVTSGSADTGLGIESVARSKGLDFVPLLEEEYHLVCLKSALMQAPVVALRQLLTGKDWMEKLSGVRGYRSSRSGNVLALNRLLPWWSFDGKARRSPK